MLFPALFIWPKPRFMPSKWCVYAHTRVCVQMRRGYLLDCRFPVQFFETSSSIFHQTMKLNHSFLPFHSCNIIIIITMVFPVIHYTGPPDARSLRLDGASRLIGRPPPGPPCKPDLWWGLHTRTRSRRSCQVKI